MTYTEGCKDRLRAMATYMKIEISSMEKQSVSGSMIIDLTAETTAVDNSAYLNS